MPQIRILTITENKEPWLLEAQNIYLKKLNHFESFEIVVVKPYREARAQGSEKMDRESEALLKKIDDKDYVILCDLEGKESSSLEFSQKIENLLNHFSGRRWAFVIGGAYGVNQSLRERADLKIKLSKMTMNHHVAQLFLLEQIYRAFTILKKIPYHNE